jgi:hypothetical protein
MDGRRRQHRDHGDDHEDDHHHHHYYHHHPRRRHGGGGAPQYDSTLLADAGILDQFASLPDTPGIASLLQRTDHLLACLSPTPDAHRRRMAVFDFTRSVIADCFGPAAKTVLIGSCALKTYLPDADIDMSVFVPRTPGTAADPVAALTAHICTVMQRQQAERAAAAVASTSSPAAAARGHRPRHRWRHSGEEAPLQFHSVTCISADTCVIKCQVDNVSVDITFGQENAVASLELFERFDAAYIGRDHILKKSILLLKAWFIYDAAQAAGDDSDSSSNISSSASSSSSSSSSNSNSSSDGHRTHHGGGGRSGTAGTGAAPHHNSGGRGHRGHQLGYSGGGGGPPIYGGGGPPIYGGGGPIYGGGGPPIYGAKDGGLCTYALNTMVTCLLNTHDVRHPLQAFILFFKVFADFDWDRFYVTLFGFVPLRSKDPMQFLGGGGGGGTPNNNHNNNNDDNNRMHSTAVPLGVVGAGGGGGGGAPLFPALKMSVQQVACFPDRAIRSINIQDPLMAANNLGRSVSSATARRFRGALSRGRHNLCVALSRSVNFADIPSMIQVRAARCCCLLVGSTHAGTRWVVVLQ